MGKALLGKSSNYVNEVSLNSIYRIVCRMYIEISAIVEKKLCQRVGNKDDVIWVKMDDLMANLPHVVSSSS